MVARKARKWPQGMGSVYRRGNSAWRIRWTIAGRTRYKRGYPDKQTAEAVLHKVLADAGRERVDQARAQVDMGPAQGERLAVPQARQRAERVREVDRSKGP